MHLQSISMTYNTRLKLHQLSISIFNKAAKASIVVTSDTHRRMEEEPKIKHFLFVHACVIYVVIVSRFSYKLL